MSALALTDRDGICGAVEFYLACREVGVKPILGVELTETDGGWQDGPKQDLVVRGEPFSWPVTGAAGDGSVSSPPPGSWMRISPSLKRSGMPGMISSSSRPLRI